MLRKALYSKIHRAVVTHCNVNYVGSITIDAELLRATDMRPNECVLIADCENGHRFETYIFEGEPGSGVIGVNGAAARLVKTGDHIIICAWAQMTEEELDNHEAKVIVVDEHNRIAQRISYPSRLRDAELAK